jgi:hypothetical protein
MLRQASRSFPDIASLIATEGAGFIPKTKNLLRDVNSFASSTVLKQGFNGNGAVVSYLENKGDNHETYDNSISLCVRALQHGRTCKHGSSRAERQDPSYVA